MTDIEKMTDEELKTEWGESAPVMGEVRDGMMPHWTPDQQRRHTAAKAELERRGFVSEFYGEWEKPDA